MKKGNCIAHNAKSQLKFDDASLEMKFSIKEYIYRIPIVHQAGETL